MGKIYLYIIGVVAILAPITYFGVSYSAMKVHNKSMAVDIARLNDEKTTLLRNVKAKAIALTKCEENAENIAYTAGKIDKNHKTSEKIKVKIDKVIDKVIENKVSIPDEYKKCIDTKQYSRLINEVYYPN